MKRLFTLFALAFCCILAQAEERLVQYQTWYGDNMGSTNERTATKKIEFFYDSHNVLVRKVQTGLMENGMDWLLTNYYLLNYNESGNLAQSYSMQYGVYDQYHYSLKTSNDTILYNYDKAGRLTEEANRAKNQSTRYSYDTENRVEKVEIWKSGKWSQTLTYSNFTLGGAQSVKSEASSSYNCYEGTLTYDEQGHKTSEKRFDQAGVLVAAEYWMYDAQGNLKRYEKKGISKGEEIDSQMTAYTVVDEATTRAMSYTYYNGDWKLKGGSTCETVTTVLNNDDATTLSAIVPDSQHSTVTFTINVPEAWVGKASLNVYRDGLLLKNIPAESANINYLDEEVRNGDHEYFVQTIVDNQNSHVSNIAKTTINRLYPRATNLHATKARKTTDGNYLVTLAWNVPTITEDMAFVNHNVIKIGKYYSTPMLEDEEALTDANANQIEVSFGIDAIQTVYLQTRYQGATVCSDTITVDATKIQGKVDEVNRMLHTTETWGDAMGNDNGMTKKEVYYYGEDNRVKRIGRYSKAVGTDAKDPQNWTIYEYVVNIYGESGMLEKQYTRQYGRYDHGEMGYRSAQDTTFYEYNVEGQMVRQSNKMGYTEYEYSTDGSLVKEHNVEYAVPTNIETTITYSDFAGKDKPRMTVSDGTRSSQQWMLETEYDDAGRKSSEKKSNYKTASSYYIPAQWQEFYYDAAGELLSDTVFTIKIVNGIEQYSYKSYTSYEAETGNANRVKVVKRVWDSILKKFGNPKTWNVYEYADINGKKYSPTLTLEPTPEKDNAATLAVSIPDAIQSAMAAFNVYRDGIEIAHAIPYFDAEHYTTDEYGLNGVWVYHDTQVKNGDYDYFVEYAQLDNTMTDVAKRNNISNVAFITFNTALPCPTGLREISRRQTSTANSETGVDDINIFVTLGWDAPENVEGYNLQGYEVMVVGSQISENYDATDKTATTYELALRGLKQMEVYVEAIYPIGRACSDTILVEETPAVADWIESLSPSSNTTYYNLRGQQVKGHKKGILILRKGSKGLKVKK